MKVLLLNGSPHPKGSTYTALCEVAKTLEENGVETELIQVGHLAIRGCIGCGQCRKLGHCVFEDAVNEIAPKFEAADGLVLGSPVYYASANSTLTVSLMVYRYAFGTNNAMGYASTIAIVLAIVIMAVSRLSEKLNASERLY